MPPRTRLVLSTMLVLTVLWFLSTMSAAASGISLFAIGHAGVREIGAGVLAFGLLLLAIPVSRAIRRPEEERKQLLLSLAPRNGREFALFALVAVMAGVAEESAYRGVAVWILVPVMGNIVAAMFLSAMAFAVAHAVQGGKTMALVFAVAVVFHLLVYVTGTLVIAMVVHAAYDMVAGYAAGQRAKALEAADATAATAATAVATAAATPG
jgi:membrane protease YdiL (CAAX protease family)